MHSLLRIIIPAGLLVLSFLSGCSPQANLSGTWRAETAGETLITLEKDGTASASVDMNVGLLGRVQTTSTGIWKIVGEDRLLLEMETLGARGTEVNRFVLDGDDLILTSEKSGQSLRYRRVAGKAPRSEPDPKVRAMRSPKEEVMNNLRYIHAAADQYCLETGATTVTYEQLVGVYFSPRECFAGERYEGLVLDPKAPVSVRLSSGEVVQYKP